MEAPESWAEDFGEASLVGGKAEVKIDPDFAAVIHTDEYHVFLTPYGSTSGLRVTARQADRFTVRGASERRPEQRDILVAAGGEAEGGQSHDNTAGEVRPPGAAAPADGGRTAQAGECAAAEKAGDDARPSHSLGSAPRGGHPVTPRRAEKSR